MQKRKNGSNFAHCTRAQTPLLVFAPAINLPEEHHGQITKAPERPGRGAEFPFVDADSRNQQHGESTPSAP